MIADKWIWTGIAVGAAGLASGILLLARPETGRLTLPEEQPAAVQTQAPEESPQQLMQAAPQMPDTDMFPQGGFVLKLRDNTLFVYQEGSRDPLGEYELPSGWLPDYDRILLEYGIQVQSREELRALLEDYVS